MTVGGVLLVYAVAVGTIGLIWFERSPWPQRTPRLAIAVYLAACWSALAGLLLAGLALAVPTTALGGGISATLGACILRLRAAYATPGGAAVAVVGLAASGVLVMRVVAVLVRQVTVTRRQARRQVDLALLVGRRLPGLDALVIDDAHAAAFCVGGARPTVVLTSTAVGALDEDQLRAVLAHERAHIVHRHHRLLTAAKVLSKAVPMLPLLREAPTQLGRLVEMHADDSATQHHDGALLAEALMVLATSCAAEPALSAGATDALARMHRLLAPAPPVAVADRRLAGASVVALLILPVLFALTPAFVALAQGRVAPQ